MVYRRRKYTTRRKPTVFKSRKSLKQSAWKRSVASIAKRVALRQAETKHVARQLGLAYNLNHNTGYRVADNLLYSNLGVGDGTTASRIGDTVILRGIKLYMSLGSLTDTPGNSYRIMVYKVRKQYADITTPPLKAISGISILDPPDMEKVIKVMYDRTFTDRYMNTVIGLTAPPDPEEPIQNTGVTLHRKVWIPLSGQYVYDDGSVNTGRDWQLGMWIVAFQNRQQITGTPIATAGFFSEFFFKDP